MPCRRQAAHPRSRGENYYPQRIVVKKIGLIPAHAGKTNLSSCGCTLRRAHPRSRGENAGSGLPGACAPGSSPLTRGKHPRLAVRRLPRRLIPAHAGKTRPPQRESPGPEAHPRSRGENSHWPDVNTGSGGSSPLTRGKPHTRGRRPHQPGLIPAHAGKTYRVKSDNVAGRAHPRSRGENSAAYPARPSLRGSSPLTRGKRILLLTSFDEGRLIPAHAGKTRPTGLQCSRLSAHPRSRGENRIRTMTRLMRRGSSPLTRGKPYKAQWYGRTLGLIPAHAGKTPSPSYTVAGHPAHPRSRGENT